MANDLRIRDLQSHQAARIATAWYEVADFDSDWIGAVGNDVVGAAAKPSPSARARFRGDRCPSFEIIRGLDDVGDVGWDRIREIERKGQTVN